MMRACVCGCALVAIDRSIDRLMDRSIAGPPKGPAYSDPLKPHIDTRSSEGSSPPRRRTGFDTTHTHPPTPQSDHAAAARRPAVRLQPRGGEREHRCVCGRGRFGVVRSMMMIGNSVDRASVDRLVHVVAYIPDPPTHPLFPSPPAQPWASTGRCSKYSANIGAIG